MDKKIAIEKLNEIKFRIKSLEKEKTFEVEQLMKEKVHPLTEQIKQITDNIILTTDFRYKDVLSQLEIEEAEIKTIVDKFNIEEAKELWYPEGTIVSLWKQKGSFFRKEAIRTESKGVVEIYDGTQKMSSTPAWKMPSKGDILVRHIKKNGALGLKFDQISEYGEIKKFIPYWFSEDETIHDNLLKRRKENEEN